MTGKKFDNVWFALENSEADAINMTLRCNLMTSIEAAVAAWNLPQSEAAKRLGLTRPRLPGPASMTCCAAKSASSASMPCSPSPAAPG